MFHHLSACFIEIKYEFLINHTEWMLKLAENMKFMYSEGQSWFQKHLFDHNCCSKIRGVLDRGALIRKNKVSKLIKDYCHLSYIFSLDFHDFAYKMNSETYHTLSLKIWASCRNKYSVYRALRYAKMLLVFV